NYERRTEPHFGSRNVIQYTGNIQRSKITLHGGLEMQQGLAAAKVYQNKDGFAGPMTSDDEIATHQYVMFAQGTLELPKSWIVTAGASLNILDVEMQRFS